MGALTAALAGALAVFVLGVVREWWRNERERRGLLLLLRAELDHNAEVVRIIVDRRGDQVMNWIGSPELPFLKTETWREVRGRAAELLPDALLADLDGYYSPLETVLTLLSFRDLISDSADREVREKAAEMRPDLTVGAARNPYRQYLEDMLKAHTTARERIDGYLARPRIAPFWR